ncbi:phage DNA packaging Nu1 family protein, partial [Escherichia coli 2-011-08_S3_C3]
RREVEELRQASETDLQPGTIEYERHRLTRAQADAQELKNARDSAEVVETAFCTFVLSRIAGEIASILDGIPLSVQRRFEDTDGQPLSNILLLADRIAMINPEDGNTTPLFVAQGNQLFMNDVFLKRLFAVSITSSGNPPTFSLTPEGRLTARNADISGNVNANSGTLNNVTINENCRVLGKLSANQIEGDLVKTVGKAFPRDSRAPERWPSGTVTVRIYDDQPFDRQIVIPAVAFSGAKHEREHTDIYSSCRLIVRKNGAEIYNRTALDNTLIYSGVIDMPAGHGHMTLEFSVSAWLVNNWYPTASISDLLVVVMKKATAGISIS